MPTFHEAAPRAAGRCRLLTLTLAALAVALPVTSDAQLVRSASGSNAAAITPAVTLFRADLGALNPNVIGSFGTGRREINWDGVPDIFSAPNNLPANFFNVNSPRGIVMSTPGTGLQVSAKTGNPTGTSVDFGNLDATYPGTFQPFSAQRLFTALASNIVDINFFVPGSTTAARVRGFGSVFSDVDLANTTSIQLFDVNDNSLGVFFAPHLLGSETFSFLGVSFASPVISRLRITSGNSAPGLTDQNGNLRDVVVMDDFIFGEATAIAAVPEPASIVLTATGLLMLLGVTRRSSMRRRDTNG